MIRVCIADDHAVVRAGIKLLLADTMDLVLAGEASHIQEILDLVDAGKCDIVILDVSLPGRDGIEVLSILKQRHPTLPILMFSVHPEYQYAVRAMQTGAAGYLTKSSDPEQLLTAIRQVVGGEYYITPAVAQHLATAMSYDITKPLHMALTNREYQGLIQLAEGKSVNDTAQQLYLSPKTVSTYRRRILRKLRLKTTAELIHYALSHRLVG
jgi:two-component system, NarL family, invasion response regulator UvrY